LAPHGLPLEGEMVKGAGRDFVVCFYCANEATQIVTVRRDHDTLRRWVCTHHAEWRPRQRRRRWRKSAIS
jgi:hypothetical protein